MSIGRRGRLTSLGLTLLMIAASGCSRQIQDPASYAQRPKIVKARTEARQATDASLAAASAGGRELGRASGDRCDPGSDGPMWTSVSRFECRWGVTMFVAPRATTVEGATSEMKDALEAAGCAAPDLSVERVRDQMAKTPAGIAIGVTCPDGRSLALVTQRGLSPRDARSDPVEGAGVTVSAAPLPEEVVEAVGGVRPFVWQVWAGSTYYRELR